MKPTMSLCPVCYKEIPAVVYTTNVVMMDKVCPVHGRFSAMVERDIPWYQLCMLEDSKEIYNGYFVDITSRCNLKCKYCYHKNTGEDKPLEEIIKDIEEHKDLAPFIITGGEPCLHKDIVEIVKKASEYGEVNISTNGTLLRNEQFCTDLAEAGLLYEGNMLNISLSLHKESNGLDIAFLNFCKNTNHKIWTLIYTMDSLSQMEEALTVFAAYSDVVHNFRIKSVSNVWATYTVKNSNKIFTSDMVKEISKYGEIRPARKQKVSVASIGFQGLEIRLVHWYDIMNIDLWDIDCPPYYKARNGKLYNMLTACIINEGLAKGCEIL